MNVPRAISSFLNPLFVSFYFFIITLNLSPHVMTPLPEKAKWMIYGLIIITTYIIPGLFITLYGNLIQRVFNYGNNEKKMSHLFIAAIFYFLTYYLLRQINLSPVYTLFVLGSTTLLGVSIFITLFWNISIYMLAMGAFSGAMIGISMIFNINLLFPIFMVILLSGLLGYSRLSLGEHRPLEVYGGYLIGLSGMILHYFFF